MKTDGHMVSILFEKDSRLFVPLSTKDVKMQKTGANLQTWEKGMYPLYKNPIGITLNDRIIGIDPGVRDIICDIDCQYLVLKNKYTTKQHSFNYSHAPYKLRSGMDWIKQKELVNKALYGIELCHDRLETVQFIS